MSKTVRLVAVHRSGACPTPTAQLRLLAFLAGPREISFCVYAEGTVLSDRLTHCSTPQQLEVGATLASGAVSRLLLPPVVKVSRFDYFLGMSTSPKLQRTFPLLAADGYLLQAMHYPCSGKCLGHLIIAGATGVPQRFYTRFAQFAADQQFEVWTLDYRGIGLSRPACLSELRMNYLDWARLDLEALVSHVAAQSDPVWMVGHSYGGHAFGLLRSHAKVQRFATFATGAGWHGWMPPLERLRVLFMWRVLGPVIVRAKGYLAWSVLGMGEDLPRDVFWQWRHWCQWPRYFFDDPAQAALVDQFAQVRTPILAINATDDKWAPPASRDAFMAGYTQAPVERVTVSPQELGMAKIGHMDYFRPQAAPLWQQTLDWLIGK